MLQGMKEFKLSVLFFLLLANNLTYPPHSYRFEEEEKMRKYLQGQRRQGLDKVIHRTDHNRSAELLDSPSKLPCVSFVKGGEFNEGSRLI